MEKMKYILIIAISLIAGVIIGWLVFSGGGCSVYLPDTGAFTTITDTVYTDTVKIVDRKIVRDTVNHNCTDTILVVRSDTVSMVNLADGAMPHKIGENLYLSNAFEYSFEYRYRNDTIIPRFRFPEMIADVIHRHGRDSVRVAYTEIYRDYWYNNIYVELAKGLLIMAAGYYMHDAGDGSK